MSKLEVKSQPTVFVLDDDREAAEAVAALARACDWQSQVFHSPTDFWGFMQDVPEGSTGCAVLEFRVQGLDGLEVQRRLWERGLALPAIFVTGRADTASTVRAMRNGALAVLDKPFECGELRSLMQEALDRGEGELQRRRYQCELESRFKRLSQQDRQVLQLIMEGCKNRSMSKRLEVSLRTVENRRRRVFDVMQAESVAQLARMVVEYEHKLPGAPPASGGWMDLPFERVA